MISVAQFVFNPFQENTYVVWDETGRCIIVDAGNYSEKETKALTDFISSKGLTPTALVNTHGHVDHVLGIAALKKLYGIPFMLGGDDEFLLRTVREHGKMYGFTVGEVPAIDVRLNDGDEVRFGDTALKVIATPGHTPGHVALYDPESGTLFTGDTLFRESIGRTDLPGGDYGWIMRSILDRIVPLGDATVIRPGHGPESTIGHETLYNPFLTEVLGGEVNYE